jgi:two-component system alkaline phosphatase synthesis response regulator PhoP
MNTPPTVLIIDDDADFRRAVGGLLTASGFVVSTATNGREGLALAISSNPDLILLDVMMDERTEGFFTLHQIRRVPALRQTPVIVVSSIYTDQPMFRVDPDAGWLPASLFLPKPVDPVRLLRESARLIAAPSRDGAEGLAGSRTP